MENIIGPTISMYFVSKLNFTEFTLYRTVGGMHGHVLDMHDELPWKGGKQAF